MASRVLPLLFILIIVVFGLDATAAPPSGPSAAAALVDPYTVGGVDVDVTAASATAAKDQAIAQGSRQAFQTLIERLTAPKDRARLPKVDGVDYVSDYAIDQERASRVRYIAALTVHFNAGAVRKLLRANNIAIIERTVHPIVVLPVFRSGGKSVLWEDPNPWRTQWSQAGTASVVALFVPGDAQQISTDQALAGDGTALGALGGRYHTADVLVLVAEVSGDGHKVDVSAIVAPGAVKPPFDTLNYTAKGGETPDQLLARAARDVARAIDAQFRQAVETDVPQGASDDSLWALVSITGLDDWVGIRERLGRGGGVVRSWELLSLTRTEAAVVLHVGTDMDQVKAALAQAGLELAQGEGYLTLRTLPPRR